MYKYEWKVVSCMNYEVLHTKINHNILVTDDTHAIDITIKYFELMDTVDSVATLYVQ